MSKKLKECLLDFDTDTLDSLEYSRYLNLLDLNGQSKVIALLKLVTQYETTSIGLLYLKWAIDRLEKNIEYYE
jgi:hypothetical protein